MVKFNIATVLKRVIFQSQLLQNSRVRVNIGHLSTSTEMEWGVSTTSTLSSGRKTTTKVSQRVRVSGTITSTKRRIDMRFVDIVNGNGHTIVHYSKGRAGREYERVFD